jgi:L-alanine-DL-glutamate epimerase-like enolase superfamily enzyme
MPRTLKIVDLVLRRLVGRPKSGCATGDGSLFPWWISGKGRGTEAGSAEEEQLVSDFLEVHTDENIKGVFGPLRGDYSILLLGSIRRQVIGLDALALEQVHDAASRAAMPGHPGQCSIVLGALDCALWDIRGKVFDCPVYQLLGGPVRREVPCYASLLGFDAGGEDSLDVAQEIKFAGFAGQKWALREGPEQAPTTLGRNVERVTRLRGAVGEGYALMVDALCSWNHTYALEFCNRVAGLDLTWLEEPLASGRISELAELRDKCGVPIAAGEHVYSDLDAHEHLRRRALDFFQPDAAWCGLTLAGRMVCLARVWDVAVVPHGNGLLPALHLAASQLARWIPMLEYHVTLESRRQYFFKRPLRPVKGVLMLPEASGLGTDIDDSKVVDSWKMLWPE